MTALSTIAATEIPRLCAEGATILDVRQPDEHDALRLAGAHCLIPLGALSPKDFMLRQGLLADDTVYILCRSGKRAAAAAEQFIAAGYPQAVVIEGGILACAECGVPTAGETDSASPATGGCA